MLRNFAAALALILLSQSSFGLGLGTLKQSSALNELFDGRVEILGTNAGDLDEIIVRLADSEQFERAGVARDAVLLQLKFKIVDGGGRADYIQITSREPIREPFLNFLIALNWAKGRMVREYTALLDPPLYDPVRRQVEAPPVAATPAPAVVAPTPPAVTTTESAAPMPSMSSTTVVEPTAPAAYDADSTLRPVEVNDTLWSIAGANLLNNSTSVQQMMLALLRANPEAFGANNINILKRGSILRLPDEAEIYAMSRAEAIAEVQRHHQLWSDYRDVATETVAEAPIGQPSADTEPMDDSELMAGPEPSEDAEPMADIDDLMVDDEPAEMDEPEDTDARLELVAPEDGDEMGAGDGEADVTLAREELDAQVRKNMELQARIAEANEIIDLMSRQVDIKDDELAALQARLLELGIEAPPDVLAGLDAGDESDTEMMVDDELMAEETPIDSVEMGGMDEEIPGVADALGEVDITIGDDADTAVGDVLPEDIDQSTEESDVGFDDGGGAEADGGGSLLGGLIPAHISNMVPGGAMTVLGILGVVLLGIFAALFKLIGGRNKDDGKDFSAVASAARDEDATPLTEGLDEEEEPITETRDVGSNEYSSADTTEISLDDDTTDIAPEMAETDVSSEIAETENDMVQTLESTAAELAGEQSVEDELEEDPLEEVNVYLAYERFDQAEELVRKVIGEYPEDHMYKLRLLEVFYSANNKVAYEEAARALYDGVGESDPLWGSAVAMWTEMSPECELFAEGAAGAEEAPADKPEVSEVVDITALDEPDKDTMSMGPGSDAVLESTQIGLGVADDACDDDSGSLDDDDLLNVTVPSMISDGDTLPVGGPLDTEGGIDFDISDTIVPAFGVNDEVATDEEAGFDLSLQSSDLDDLSIGGDTVGGPALDEDTGDESEIEFDLALEDTTEMDKVVVDETLELPKADSADESLEDLAKSMEEGMADLELRDDDLPEAEVDIDELDLSFTATEGTLDIDLTGDIDDAEPSLDFDIVDLDLEDIDQADTLALDLSVGDDDDAPLDQDTVALPPDGDVEQQSDADEVDTKLNLAKAYIELGDNDGARSILDEVARDGSDVQQTEAQRLLEQLD